MTISDLLIADNFFFPYLNSSTWLLFKIHVLIIQWLVNQKICMSEIVIAINTSEMNFNFLNRFEMQFRPASHLLTVLETNYF